MSWFKRALALALLLGSATAFGCGSDVDAKTGTVLDGELSVPITVVDPIEHPNCSSANASTGASCKADCITGCGYTVPGSNGQRLGTKVCPCIGGVFTQCPCLKRPEYGGAETAPLCATPYNFAMVLDGVACNKEWDQCIGNDPVGSATPRGCVCLAHAMTGALTWDCGSTNRFFRLEGT